MASDAATAAALGDFGDLLERVAEDVRMNS